MKSILPYNPISTIYPTKPIQVKTLSPGSSYKAVPISIKSGDEVYFESKLPELVDYFIAAERIKKNVDLLIKTHFPRSYKVNGQR